MFQIYQIANCSKPTRSDPPRCARCNPGCSRLSGAIITGMRSRISAMRLLAGQVTKAKVRAIMPVAPSVQLSHNVGSEKGPLCAIAITYGCLCPSAGLPPGPWMFIHSRKSSTGIRHRRLMEALRKLGLDWTAKHRALIDQGRPSHPSPNWEPAANTTDRAGCARPRVLGVSPNATVQESHCYGPARNTRSPRPSSLAPISEGRLGGSGPFCVIRPHM